MKSIRLKWRVEKNDMLFFLAMAVGLWLFGRILSETPARYFLQIETEFLGTAFLAFGSGIWTDTKGIFNFRYNLLFPIYYASFISPAFSF